MHSLLTIAIPVYNRDQYFEEALQSALSQTIPCPVLVVDNASIHDRFQKICEAKQHEGKDVRYVRNSTNLGLFGNWNRCGELAQTEFVVILCDDDKLSAYYHEEFQRAYAAYPEIDYFYGTLNRFGEKYEGHPSQDILFGAFRGIEAIRSAAYSGLAWPTNATAYRTRHLRTHPFRFCTPKRASNADWLQVYTASANSLCYGINRPLYHYRQHDTQGGHVYAQYATLTRSLVFAEMARILATVDDPAWESALLESVAMPVHVAISLGNKLAAFVHDGLRDGDPFVQFVVEGWGNISKIIKGLYSPASSVEFAATLAIVRGARFSSRKTDWIWKRLLVSNPPNMLDRITTYLSSFRDEPHGAGIQLPAHTAQRPQGS